MFVAEIPFQNSHIHARFRPLWFLHQLPQDSRPRRQRRRRPYSAYHSNFHPAGKGSRSIIGTSLRHLQSPSPAHHAYPHRAVAAERERGPARFFGASVCMCLRRNLFVSCSRSYPGPSIVIPFGLCHKYPNNIPITNSGGTTLEGPGKGQPQFLTNGSACQGNSALALVRRSTGGAATQAKSWSF